MEVIACTDWSLSVNWLRRGVTKLGCRSTNTFERLLEAGGAPFVALCSDSFVSGGVNFRSSLGQSGFGLSLYGSSLVFFSSRAELASGYITR